MNIFQFRDWYLCHFCIEIFVSQFGKCATNILHRVYHFVLFYIQKRESIGLQDTIIPITDR